jgi:hypothetical protein
MSRDGAFQPRLRVTNQRVHPAFAELYFLRWQGEGKPRLPNVEPDEWIELWPTEPAVFDDLNTGKRAAVQALEGYNHGTFDWGALETLPYNPLRWELAEEVPHPDLRTMAAIGLRSDGRYEVRYFEYDQSWEAEPGAPTEYRNDEWEWWRVRSETLTMADSLDSAREIAGIELPDIAAAAGTKPMACRLYPPQGPH